ncbi:MAG: ROK family protein [Allosphingosinicella sp.]
MGSGLIAGVELGGTKCVCTLARGREVVDQARVATTSPEATLGGLRAVLDRWWAERGFEAVGVASFGPIELDPASPAYGSITETTKPQWPRTDVLGRLSRGFDVPTAFDTDVNGAAFAEMAWGAGQGMEDFAYITVGTGVGVGLIVNGRPTRGFAHCEMGHIPIPRLPGDDWEGACSYHGGCVEGLASGHAIEARLAGRDVGAVPADDPLWDGVAHALAMLCHVIVVTAAPRRIVVGGGVIDRQPHLLPRIEPLLRESMAGYMPLPDAGAYVTAPGLGALAGPLGPIALAQAALDRGDRARI